MGNYFQLWNSLGHGLESLVNTRSPRASSTRRPGRGKRVPRVDFLEDRTLMSVGLDPTFGMGGEVQLTYPASSGNSAYVNVTSSAIQPDGKIVVGGTLDQYSMSSSGSSTEDLIVFRLNPDGSPDSSFGSGGRTVISVQAGGTHVDSTGGYVDLQPDGKILVGGSDTLNPSATSSDTGDFVIARLTAAGALDTSFNSTGIQTVNIGNTTANDYSSSLAGLALTPDGKIVAAGTTTPPSPGPTASASQDFVVARLTSAGALDTSFNNTGTETINFTAATPTTPPSNDTASGVVVQTDGKIVVAGTTSTTLPSGSPFPTTSDFAIARLGVNGGLDTTFNGTGKQTVAFDLGGDKTDNANAVALQSDGSIVLAGYATESSSTYNSQTNTYSGVTKTDLALARLTPGGTLDTAFGSGGKVVTQVTSQGVAYSTQAMALVIEPTGTILVGGSASLTNSYGGYALLAQYTTTGGLDPTYGTGGIALVPGSTASSIAVDSSGKVLYVDNNNGTVNRTTPPAPAVVSATYTPIRKGKSLKFNSVKIKFNTKLNAVLAGKKGDYQLRVGSKGKKFIKINNVTYDASSNTVTLSIKSTAVPSTKSGGLFALFTASGIHSADSQMLNGGNDLAVQVTQAS